MNFYEDFFRVNHHVLLDGWTRSIVGGFFSSVGSFCGWREHLDDDAGVVYRFFLVLVALVAAYGEIGVDVALFGELELNVGIVDTALAALEWSLDGGCQVGDDDRVVRTSPG